MLFCSVPVNCFSKCLFDPLGEGNGTPLQYSCLENPMEGAAWWAAVHGVTESWTQLSDFTFTFHFHALVKEMATHSSVLAWKIPETEEPGGLPSVGSHRVEHDWSDLAAVAPTPSTLYDMSQRRQKVTFLECFFCMFSAFKDLNSIYCMFNPE